MELVGSLCPPLHGFCGSSSGHQGPAARIWTHCTHLDSPTCSFIETILLSEKILDVVPVVRADGVTTGAEVCAHWNAVSSS